MSGSPFWTTLFSLHCLMVNDSLLSLLSYGEWLSSLFIVLWGMTLFSLHCLMGERYSYSRLEIYFQGIATTPLYVCLCSFESICPGWSVVLRVSVCSVRIDDYCDCPMRLYTALRMVMTSMLSCRGLAGNYLFLSIVWLGTCLARWKNPVWLFADGS